MGKIPGIAHLRAVKALERAGLRIARQGKHIVMTDGVRIVTIPRHDPSTLIRWAALCEMLASALSTFGSWCKDLLEASGQSRSTGRYPLRRTPAISDK
jgi:hypothetical protein